MSFSNWSETEILNYIGPGVAPAFDGQASYWLSLHTADPGEAGTAVTSEVTGVTGYARREITRSTDLSVTGNVLTNVNLEQFPLSSGGSPATVTHCCIVDTASGAGNILFRTTLPSSIPYQTGVRPQIEAGSLTFTLD